MDLSSPQALLLDLDGTLADSLSAMRLAYQAFLGLFGIEPSGAEFDSLNGPPLSDVVRRLAATHSLAGEHVDLLAHYNAVIDDTYARVLPNAGAQYLLRRAKAHDCVLGVVTSNSARRAHAWLEVVGLSGWIDFIVAGEDVRQGKPHPEPYLLACSRAARPVGAIVAVEDSAQGVQAAVAAGLHTFALAAAPVLTPWPQGVRTVASLGELARLLWADDPSAPT